MSRRSLNIWLPVIRAGSGADVFATRLAKGLLKAGHKPQLQWFDHRYELTPWLLKQVPAPTGTDIVHAGSWQGFAFKRKDLPLVVTEHQYVLHPKFTPHRSMLQTLYHRAFIERCMRRSYQGANAVVAVSQHVADAMRSDMDRQVEVIHNWVDCSVFSPAAAARAARAGKSFRLLFVGNPSRWKGAEILPELASRLGANFEIRCLGGLRKSFDASGWPSNITLLPRVESEQMPEVYRSVDAALVPTRYEAFGYVALEAMACGLPVLGFASTGTAEVAIHEETALLAPVNDVMQLEAYARNMADNQTLCDRLSHAGRKRAVDYFDEFKAVDAYVSLYLRVMQRS